MALVEEHHVVEVAAIGGGETLAVDDDPILVVTHVQPEVERVIRWPRHPAGPGGHNGVDTEIDQ